MSVLTRQSSTSVFLPRSGFVQLVLHFIVAISIINIETGVEMGNRRNLSTCLPLMIWVGLLLFVSIAYGESASSSITIKHANNSMDAFKFRTAQLWGNDNVWIPSPTVWVQYESDFGERSAVNFESGTVTVQLIVDPKESFTSDLVIAHLRQGLRNLILGDAEDPIEMVVLSEQGKKSVTIPDPYTSHDLTLGYVRPAASKNTLLLDQICNKDGKSIAYEDVDGFANEIVTIKTVKKKILVGNDGIKRQAVSVEFDLAPNHLEIRAKRFYPLVKLTANKYGLNPSLIMGIIHTESMFNPRARSHSPAFGLMQLVPRTGAREAYLKLHGKNRTPSPRYLYSPDNNVELGVVYLDILMNRYMNQINDETSRIYCAVAAYNAGASNVGKAFISKKSIKKASPVINKLAPYEVYDQLTSSLPMEESRAYVQKVMTRSVIYSAWN